MRAFIFACLVLLGACARGQEAARCDVSASHDIAFAGGGAQTVTARAFGPACDKAIALYTVHDGEGRPVWAWTAPLARAFGDDFHAADEERVRTFVEQWAQAKLETSAAAPEWRALLEGQSNLDRLTYEDIRARDLPVLCHLSGVGRETCVFWEPAAGAAGLFYERDVAVVLDELDAR